MGLGVLDTFQHAWDLARATGQDTDLAPEMAAALLMQAELHVAQTSRGPEPAPYGPIQITPAGASTADPLAAFLGRTVWASQSERAVEGDERAREDELGGVE